MLKLVYNLELLLRWAIWSIGLLCYLFVWVVCSTQEFFTHMEMSPLSVKVKMLIYTLHSWPLSIKSSLACHTYSIWLKSAVQYMLLLWMVHSGSVNWTADFNQIAHLLCTEDLFIMVRTHDAHTCCWAFNSGAVTIPVLSN